jgi:hypothetical protein
MGQAKNRGTFEQRVEQSREKWNQSIEVQRQDIEQMDALEKRQLEAMGNFLTTRVLPSMERQYGALMRIDFTKIPLKATQEPKETA